MLSGYYINNDRDIYNLQYIYENKEIINTWIYIALMLSIDDNSILLHGWNHYTAANAKLV
jgi:hypothetical protein